MTLTVERDGDVLRARAEGRVSEADMRAFVETLPAAMEGIERGAMVMEIEGFEWPEAGAMAVELAHMPMLFKLMWRIKRVAVVCDEAWIRNWAAVEGALLPTVSIKGFATSEREAAERFAQNGIVA